MALVRIDGPGDARVNAYRQIAEHERVREHGLFVAEGRLVVQRLVEDRRCAVRSLLLSDAAYGALQPMLDSALSPDVPVYLCASGDFRGITGFDLHRGCLALAERPAPVAVDDLVRNARIVVVLEGLSNADNVGAVFRNGAAFGVDAVLLSPTCCDPLYRKAVRTSMAATLRVPFARIEPWPGGLERLRRHGFSIVALTPARESQTLDAFLASQPLDRVAFMVGTEGEGLTAAVKAMADHRVSIPIKREVDSLNLAVATGIVLSRLMPSLEPAP